MSSLQLKKNYRCVPALQQFYSGGPFAVSSDGSFIACACGEAIKIVDSSNGSIKATIEGDTEAVTALTLSADDKILFSAGHSRQIRVWNLESNKCIRSWKGHDGPVMGMACHASGGYLATAGADRKVLVWDVDGGFCTHHFKGHRGVVSTIRFHPDEKRNLLFSGGDDATIRIWNLQSKKCVATFEEKHGSTVTSVDVSEDGQTLLTAGRDGVVNLWDLHNFKWKKTLPTSEVLEALCVVGFGSKFAGSKSRKNKSGAETIYFLSVGERGVLRIWDSERAVCVYEQKSSDVTSVSDVNESQTGFTAAVILPSDQGLLCVTADHQFLFYSLDDNPEVLVLSRRLIGYNEEILDMRFLGEDENFLAVVTNVEQVRVYDLASMSCSFVLSGHKEMVLCLDTGVLTSGRAVVVTGSKDNNVRLWDVESRKCTGIGTGHMEGVGAVAFSRRWKNFFVSGSSDRTIKVWSIDGITDDVDQPINLKAKAVVAAHDKDINTLAVAPNDSLVCSGSQDRTACVWKLPDLVSVVVLKGHKRGIWSVEFSPVDQCVITASGDKTIKIWAIPDGSCLKTFEGHTSSVLRASFLTRGTQFVSCGADGLVKLWTVRTNECIATYDQHDDKVWALAVGKKTEMFATGGSDAKVNLWYDSTAADKEEAFRKEEESLLKGQELENALLDADYTKAIQIAFELRRPHRLYELFSEIFRKGAADNQLEKALHNLGKEEFRLLLEYIREWNTKPKLCHVAQQLLFRVFNILPPTELIEIKGIGELLEGLIPYSERHFSRIDRLVRSSFLVDYTLTAMSVIEPNTQIESQDKPLAQPNFENSNIPQAAEHADDQERVQEQEMPTASEQQTASKKRKSSKSKGGSSSHKKQKPVAYTSVNPVLSKA